MGLLRRVQPSRGADAVGRLAAGADHPGGAQESPGTGQQPW